MSGDESKPAAEEASVASDLGVIDTGEDAPVSDASNAQSAESGGADSDAPGAELTDAELHVRELESLRLQIAQRDDALLRLQAEMENLRKRGQRDLENAHKFGIEKLLTELLPVKDSMELGLASVQGADADTIAEGLNLTDKMLASALEKYGVALVDPTGQAFDPEKHQAMTMQEVEGVAPGQVVTVFQKGYLLKDRLIRPAMVIVSK